MRRSSRSLALGASLSVLLVGGWQLSNSRSWQLFGELTTRAETDSRVVALTFDDGPSPEGTAAVLSSLGGLEVRATFFVTGAALEAHPDLGRRIVAAGHALGNHSYSHTRMVFRSTSHAPPGRRCCGTSSRNPPRRSPPMRNASRRT